MKKKPVHFDKKLVIHRELLSSLAQNPQSMIKGGAMTMDANDPRCYTWWGWCRTQPGLGRTCANPCHW